MSRDYYEEALKIAKSLEEGDRVVDGRALRDSISNGATGTEILMALNWHLERIEKSLPGTDPRKNSIRELRTAIGEALSW